MREGVLIFVDNISLDAPVLYDTITEIALLQQLKMFYRYLKIRRGLPEVIIPRTISRLDCIEARTKHSAHLFHVSLTKCNR